MKKKYRKDFDGEYSPDQLDELYNGFVKLQQDFNSIFDRTITKRAYFEKHNIFSDKLRSDSMRGIHTIWKMPITDPKDAHKFVENLHLITFK